MIDASSIKQIKRAAITAIKVGSWIMDTLFLIEAATGLAGKFTKRPKKKKFNLPERRS